MELDAPQDLRFVLTYVRDRINEVVHVEDLADLLAWELFVGTQEVEAMEKELWEPCRVRTVREAYHGFNETDLAYHFMCARRLRYNVLGDQQRRMVFLKRLPPKIEATCRLQLPVSLL